ncbi:MAG: zinc-binding dehydrogenase [Chloroflexota bacterium]
MKVAVLTETGFEIQEHDNPTCQDDEVLIKTIACGVCSGDVFVYKNRKALAATHSLLGHEGSGVIAELGKNVKGFGVGDIVTTVGMPAYAEYFVVTPDMLVRLPENVDPVLALGEAIACCVHAGNRFGIQTGDRVAVIGCGFMGLICLQLAKYQGAGFICALDTVDSRLTMSQQLGADVTINPLDTPSGDNSSYHGEFDVVIEAAGVQSAIDLSTDLVKQHGRIILIGYHQSNDGRRTVNMQQWNYKAIDLVNGHVRRQDEKIEAMQQGMELLQQGYIRTEPLVTTYDLSQAELAFQSLVTGKDGLFKVVLLMDTTLP